MTKQSESRRRKTRRAVKVKKHSKLGKAVKALKTVPSKVAASGEVVQVKQPIKTVARTRKAMVVQSTPDRLRLKVVIHEAEEGGYWAEVPGFPGCVSEGDTLDEIRANIRDAFVGVFGAMQDEPTPSGLVEEI